MTDYRQLVEDLAVEHRRRQALRQLMAAGAASSAALRFGLRHPSPIVRVGCCVVLDHFLDESALPELTNNLGHENEDVRSWALHALACDRCKEGECRPGEDAVVPLALRMLQTDPSRRVRTQAAHLLGPAAPRRPDVAQALAAARDGDPDPNVRSVALRYAPGGPIFDRLSHRTTTRPSVGARRPYPRKHRQASAPA